MGLKEDIIDIRKEVNEVKEQSLAWEMLRDSKRANKRICISFASVLILVLILWSITICYLVYVLNDVGTITTATENEQTISDIDTMNDNQIINGDYNGYNKAKN